MKFLVALFGFLVLAGLVTISAGSAADYNQAQAQIETARAAQMASAGQTAATTANAVLVVLLAVVLIAAGALIAWLLIRQKRLETLLVQVQAGQLQTGSKWAPGPNARFGRIDEPPALPRQSPQDLIMTLLLAQMVQQQRPPALPANTEPARPTNQDWGW